MPTLVITGHPCSGKSTFAGLLASRAPFHKSGSITSAVVISEETARPDRTKSQCYESSRSEKATRGALKAEFDKHCTSGDAGERQRRLVILDATNYIKGFRYELHCIAKAAGERHGVAWVLCDAATADGWNRERWKRHEEEKGRGSNDDDDLRREDYYAEGQMEELRRRYEPPDERNRWDRPLYRVDVNSTLERKGDEVGGGGGGKAAEEALQRSVYDMHALSEAMGSSVAQPACVGAASEATATATATGKKTALSSAFKRKKPSSAFRRAAVPAPAPKTDEVRAVSSAADLPLSMRSQDAEPQSSTVEETMPSSALASEGASPPPAQRQGRRKMEDVVDEILDSFLSKEVSPLRQGMSTAKPVTTNANVLHDVEAITQRTSADFLTAQRSVAAVGSGRVSVPIIGGSDGEETRSVNLTRTVGVSEMKRMRRQYVRWVADHPPQDTSEGDIAASFLSYVEAQL